MKQSIILGNIITVDEKRPFAKAAFVKNGVFAYIGSVAGNYSASTTISVNYAGLVLSGMNATLSTTATAVTRSPL